MSLLSDLNTLVAGLLAGLPDGTRADTGRTGFERAGLTQGGVTFDVRPVAADPFSWERRTEGLRANLKHRFVVELRETVTGKGDAAKELAMSRMQALVSGLADTANLPGGTTIGQIVPGCPVIKTQSASSGPTTVTAQLELTVLEN